MSADEIKRIRAATGLTQTAFAIRIGVTVDTVRKYEQGAISPSTRVEAILRALVASQEALEVPA